MLPPKLALMLDLGTLKAAYASGSLTPLDVVEAVIARRAAATDAAIYISCVPDGALRQAA